MILISDLTYVRLGIPSPVRYGIRDGRIWVKTVVVYVGICLFVYYPENTARTILQTHLVCLLLCNSSPLIGTLQRWVPGGIRVRGANLSMTCPAAANRILERPVTQMGLGI